MSPDDRHPTSSVSDRLLPLSAPVFRGNEWTYLKACLDEGWVSSVGPFVERFEQAVAAAVGAPHAVAVMNGTAGLHIAMRLAGVQPDDEVVVSDLTFIAPVNAIRYCQAHPIFVDADPRSWQFDVEKLARFLGEGCERRSDGCYNRTTGRRVRAILPVHILGLACEMDSMTALARDHGLQVVEDAAEAIGVRYRGRHVGTWGEFGVFSFNGNKLITSGGGGVILAKREAHARYARYLTTQARDDASEYLHHEVGYNYRMTNLQAALGLAQLEQLEAFIERKRAIARQYEAAFQGLEGVTVMPTPPDTEPTYWLYTILLDEATAVQERQAAIHTLQALGIEARSLWHPIHALPLYRTCQTLWIEHAPRLYARAISLPSSISLTDEDIQRCIEAVRRLTSRSRRSHDPARR